ncbi:hypothetical protein LTR64_003600 [Lithohypha guttulata]|uniref:uncharacterized protein n=1 Tax=Lithohypha guttulata TaxID=1690604 RepID=UPI002DDE470A|nr:hypothetical protein LTR51_000180 [Lithohypha guttulata]
MAPSVAEISGVDMQCSTTDGESARDHQQTIYNDLGWLVEDETGYRILEQSHGTREPLRVVHIGAGASGICFSKFYQDRLINSDVTLQVYEKNHDVGGTWLENRYPGCACDIPSACYQFTWERNPNWSQYYSESPEIWRYFKDTTNKYGLNKYIKLRHEIVKCEWHDEAGQWDVTIRNLESGEEFMDKCHLLINGNGVLNNWKWPDVKGLHSFQGVLEHTARYTEGRDLTGQRVAVIGIGSSGIQCISKIAPQVKQLYTWIKTPTWITAGFAQKFAGKNGANFAYTARQKEEFDKNPALHLKYSKMIESELNQRFKFILKNTPEAKMAVDFAANEMATKLDGNEELCDAMIPKNFGVGCRRPTPGNGFLEALNRENVHVYTSLMREITPKGFVDSDGSEVEVDVIICATGFDTSWRPRFPVLGENGKSLIEMWKDRPVPSYLSFAVPHMPNYFMMGGPYGPLGHGSFLPIIETLAGNIIQIIKKMQKDRIKKIVPREEVARQFTDHADLFLKRTAWTDACSSWFKQGRIDGPVPIFPGSRLTFLDLLGTPRYEDYQITYKNDKNMFEFLGNGFDVREFDGRDLSYYLGILDGVGDKQLDLEAELSQDMEKLMPQIEEARHKDVEAVAGLS